MKNSKSKKKSKPKKNSNLLLVIIAVVLGCAAIITVIVTENSGKPDAGENGTGSKSTVSGGISTEGSGDIGAEEANDAATTDKRETTVIAEGESLVISTSEVAEDAEFYPIEVDSTEMEIIAVRDSDGNIRTAFNTCQVCYGSGRGYYIQDGEYLVCQNCGNRFTADEVEVSAGGCNPYPIFEENKTVTEDSIEISYDFLKEAKEIFANWKL